MGKLRFFYAMLFLAVSSVVILSSGCGSSSSSSDTATLPPDTTAPTAPTYLTAVAATDTKVSLRWLASTDASGVTAYIITRNNVQLATTTTATTIYTDTTCTANTQYTYAVTARDAAGNTSSPSSSATTTTIMAGYLDGSAPTVPGTLSAAATSSSQISLAWGAATDNVGVSYYTLFRSASASGAKVNVGTTTTTSYTDTGLLSGTTYYYVVRAYDGAGNESNASSEASARTQ